MPIDPKTTALLLIEYQNDFTSEWGALHNGLKSVGASRFGPVIPTESLTDK
jgi:nicotinamidase-related amidase